MESKVWYPQLNSASCSDNSKHFLETRGGKSLPTPKISTPINYAVSTHVIYNFCILWNPTALLFKGSFLYSKMLARFFPFNILVASHLRNSIFLHSGNHLNFENWGNLKTRHYYHIINFIIRTFINGLNQNKALK